MIYSKTQDSRALVYWTTPSGNHLQIMIKKPVNWDMLNLQCDLLLCAFNGVRTMADIPANGKAVVATDGTY
jgi:hypothetical protein